MLAHIEALQPDAVLSLGLAGGRYKMTPERIAINVKDGEPDNNGHTPVDEVIQSQGEDGYLSTLPIRAMVDRLIAEGLPAEISNTAGTYLCNNVMYEALHYGATQRPAMKAGFLHIPASHELAIQHGRIPSWSHEDLKKALPYVLKCYLPMKPNQHRQPQAMVTSERAIRFDFGSSINQKTYQDIQQFCRFIERDVQPLLEEVVPSMNTVTVFYRRKLVNPEAIIEDIQKNGRMERTRSYWLVLD